MARIRKEYKMTEKNVEYIEEVKEKNNLKYSCILYLTCVPNFH